MIWRRRKTVDQTAALVAAVNELSERRTEMLASLAAERRRLEARLMEVTIAEAALLTGQGISWEQPRSELEVLREQLDEFQPEPQTQVDEPEPLFAASAADDPVGASDVSPEVPAAANGDVKPFAQHFGDRQPEHENGQTPPREATNDEAAHLAEQRADQRRAEFVNRYFAANVPAAPLG